MSFSSDTVKSESKSKPGFVINTPDYILETHL